MDLWFRLWTVRNIFLMHMVYACLTDQFVPMPNPLLQLPFLNILQMCSLESKRYVAGLYFNAVISGLALPLIKRNFSTVIVNSLSINKRTTTSIHTSMHTYINYGVRNSGPCFEHMITSPVSNYLSDIPQQLSDRTL